MDLKILIACLVGLDITIIVIFLTFARKIRHIRQHISLEEEITLFESLVVDSEKTASRFKTQLDSKRQLIKTLNDKLDKRISGLNVLLNRADAMLAAYGKDGEPDEGGKTGPTPQHARALALAKSGASPEEIAEKLSLPMGEVTLLLDLNERITLMRGNEGAS